MDLPRTTWGAARLAELVGPDGLISDGDWVESKDQDPDGDVRLIQLADVGDGVFRDRSQRFMTLQKAAALRCTFLVEGDLLIARMPDPLGRGCILPHVTRPCVTVVDVAIVRPGAASVSPRWLMHAFNSPYTRQVIAGQQSGSTRGRISKSKLLEIELPIPPRPEQDRIADALDDHFTRLDAAEAALRQAHARLKRFRASVLQTAVMGRLVPTETELARREGRSYESAPKLLERVISERRKRFEASGKRGKYVGPAEPDAASLPHLPEGWCWATVDQVGVGDEQVVMTGPFGTSLGRSDFVEAGVPVITIGCLQERGIAVDKADAVAEPKAIELERYRLKSGDLLFSRMASVGRAGIVPETLAGALFNYHIMRLRLDHRVVDGRYFLSWVRGAKVVHDYVRAVNHGATRDGINTEQLLGLPIALPPLAEQLRIIDDVSVKLDRVRYSEDLLRQADNRCARLRQSALRLAFEGRLVDPDPTDEPASALLDRIRAARALAAPNGTPKTRRPPRRPKTTK